MSALTNAGDKLDMHITDLKESADLTDGTYWVE